MSSPHLSFLFLLLLSLITLSSSSPHPASPLSSCTTSAGAYADGSCEGVPPPSPTVDISSLPFPYTAVRGSPYSVSYDSRAILINSQRVLLQSGIVHYPRSTPAMWPGIMRRLREANLNTVQVTSPTMAPHSALPHCQLHQTFSPSHFSLLSPVVACS